MKKAIKTMYGSVELLKAWCDECEMYAFVIDGEYQCCGLDFISDDDTEIISHRESEGEPTRRHLKKPTRKQIIRKQRYKCIYCGDRLGKIYRDKHDGLVESKIHFDHFDCWKHSHNSATWNMVASCGRCNLIKSSKCFASLDDARYYIRRQIQKKKLKEQKKLRSLDTI